MRNPGPWFPTAHRVSGSGSLLAWTWISRGDIALCFTSRWGIWQPGYINERPGPQNDVGMMCSTRIYFIASSLGGLLLRPSSFRTCYHLYPVLVYDFEDGTVLFLYDNWLLCQWYRRIVGFFKNITLTSPWAFRAMHKCTQKVKYGMRWRWVIMCQKRSKTLDLITFLKSFEWCIDIRTNWTRRLVSTFNLKKRQNWTSKSGPCVKKGMQLTNQTLWLRI